MRLKNTPHTLYFKAVYSCSRRFPLNFHIITFPQSLYRSPFCTAVSTTNFQITRQFRSFHYLILIHENHVYTWSGCSLPSHKSINSDVSILINTADNVVSFLRQQYSYLLRLNFKAKSRRLSASIPILPTLFISYPSTYYICLFYPNRCTNHIKC